MFTGTEIKSMHGRTAPHVTLSPTNWSCIKASSVTHFHVSFMCVCSGGSGVGVGMGMGGSGRWGRGRGQSDCKLQPLNRKVNLADENHSPSAYQSEKPYHWAKPAYTESATRSKKSNHTVTPTRRVEVPVPKPWQLWRGLSRHDLKRRRHMYICNQSHMNKEGHVFYG